MNIEIYYDGTDIKNNCGENIKGFTTNISFMKSAKIHNYDSFIKDSLNYSDGRPISFQLYDDTDAEIEKSARKITSYHESIFVKIPVIKTTGESNSEVIKKLHKERVKVNITAIFTKQQIDSISNCFDDKNDVIISIFAGRINDCGVASDEIVKYACDTFRHLPNVKILWAACRTVYNMVEADKQGAHIVTVPDSVLQRMHRLSDDVCDAGLKAVQQFRKDGIDGKIGFDN